MMRLPCSRASRSHASAFSGLPMASSMSRARLGAPPWSGADKAPMAPTTAEPRSAPVEVITRAVNVEAGPEVLGVGHDGVGSAQAVEGDEVVAGGGDVGQQLLHLRLDLTVLALLTDERVAQFMGRQAAVVQQVPDVLE